MHTDFSTSELIISLPLLKKNLNVLKSKSGINRVYAVVKVNAYGHGAVPCSRYLEPEVDGFVVATFSEALELREAGINKEIILLGAPEESIAAACHHYNISVSVSHEDHFRFLKEGTRYHLNFDTGMRRLGFTPSQAERVRELVNEYSSLELRGVYTHYATADEPGSKLVGIQNTRFQALRAIFPECPAHMSNSAAVLHHDVDHFDYLRVGLGILGFSSGRDQDNNLTPVMKWQSRVSQVRPIRKGETVSYGATWTCPADGYICTIPVGYGDGIPRSLGNKLNVITGMEFHQVVGTITMDHCMIYFVDDPVKAGSVVTLMGGGAWPANRWAEEAGSITHEIFCRFTPRVTRVYKEEID